MAKLLSDTQIIQVKILYKEGKSSTQIANLFKCSKPTILRAIKDLPKRKNYEYSSFRNYNQFGDKNASWKGGIKSIYNRIRNLSAYWNWHKLVLVRDNNTCQHCPAISNLQVHHIKSLKSLVLEYCALFNKTPKELTEIDIQARHFYLVSNGLTLCSNCHKIHHKKFGR